VGGHTQITDTLQHRAMSHTHHLLHLEQKGVRSARVHTHTHTHTRAHTRTHTPPHTHTLTHTHTHAVYCRVDYI